MQPSTLAKRGSMLLFIAFTLFYFYGLGHLSFVGPDEPRYAESHLRKETVLFLIPLRDLDSLRQAESLRTNAIANNGRVAIVAGNAAVS